MYSFKAMLSLLQEIHNIRGCAETITAMGRNELPHRALIVNISFAGAAGFLASLL